MTEQSIIGAKSTVNMVPWCLLIVLAALTCCASTCEVKDSDDDKTNASAFALDQEQARKDLEVFTAKTHPFGSSYQAEMGEFFMRRATEAGATRAFKQEFTADTPNPDALEDSSAEHTVSKSGQNILATVEYGDNDCWIVVGSHYDSKIIPGIEYLGANDGGSSSVLLIQLISFFKNTAPNPGCDLLFVWFDGEEAVLLDWTTGQTVHPAKIQDNTYGSRHFVANLSTCGDNQRCYEDKPIRNKLLLDMVGMPGLKISRDTRSTSAYSSIMVEAANELGYGNNIAAGRKAIEDDHVPFINAGIPSLNIINFENLTVWHRAGDELSVISYESIEIAGQIAVLTLQRSLSLPKEI